MPTKKKTKKAAKKASRKTSSKKKAAAKKRASTSRSNTSKKWALICVNDDRCFWTTDGQILSNLEDLRDALAGMSDTVFKHHVTSEKNDFADWVEQVLDDKTLAESLRRSRKPATARTAVVRRLKVYHR